MTLHERLLEEAAQPGPGELADPESARLDLGTVMRRLTPSQQEICRLLGAEGLSVNEAAERLGMPRSSLQDEIKRIRRFFGAYGLRDYLRR